MPTVTIQSAQIHYKVTGSDSGEPALFLHGVPDAGDMWDPLIARIGGNLRAVAPDLPGLGQSTAPTDFDVSLNNLANFTEEFRHAAGMNEPLHLFVTDFGGHPGLAWAVRHPEAVRSITIFNIAFSSQYRWHINAQLWRTPLIGELAVSTMPFEMYRRVIQKTSPELSTSYLRGVYNMSFANPNVRRMILRLYREQDPRNFAGWEDQLKALTAHVPTTVMWGDRDPFAAPHFADRYGNATVHHFPEYGHWLPLEAPDAVAEKWQMSVFATA
ncbi:MAG: alpha/beta hydrolase [Anaerolineae bacterium]